jgi:putative phage-type endonuclease
MTDNFLKSRQKGIGGSDVAGIFGLSQWNSPLSIYYSKVDPIPDNQEETDPQYFGKALEPVIATRFVEVTGKKVARVNKLILSKEHPFIIANIDRRVVGERAGLEIKTASQFKAAEWNDQAPIAYILQCMHYMYVTGYEYWYIAVLIGGNKFVHFKIERDESLIQAVVDREVDFWNNNVIKRIPPDPTAIDRGIIDNLYPYAKDLENAIYLGEKANGLVSEIQEKKALIKQLKSEIEERENLVKSDIGESAMALTDNYKITWKNQPAKRFSSSNLKEKDPDTYNNYIVESTSRVLRISARKEAVAQAA